MPGPFPVTFLAGSTTALFDVSIVNDNVLESDENFTLTVNSSSISDTRVTVGSPSDSTITIMDDEGKWIIKVIFSFNSLHPYEITYFFITMLGSMKLYVLTLYINFIDFVCIWLWQALDIALGYTVHIIHNVCIQLLCLRLMVVSCVANKNSSLTTE